MGTPDVKTEIDDATVKEITKRTIINLVKEVATEVIPDNITFTNVRSFLIK